MNENDFDLTTLTEFIKVNLVAIKTDDDWSAFYRHMNAISGFLMAGGDA